MSRLGPTGLVQLLTDIKNWVLSKISAGTAAKARGLPTGTVNESSSTATLTITLDDITELYAGLAICIRMPFANAASSTLNVNNLGAKPIYYLNNTTSAGRIPANAYVILIYDTVTTSTGCWKLVYSLDTNDNNATAQNISTANNTYPVLIGYTANATANIGNKAALFGKDIKVNPSTGALYATKLYSGGTEVLTSHQSLSSYATKTYVDTSVSNLVNSAPAALDTLNELAAALGNDANFSTTVTNLIGAKADDTSVVHTSGSETIAGTKTFSSTITGSISGNAATATKATGNANGKELTNTIIKGLSVSGKTITYTQIDGTTGTLTTQDTNTDTLMTQNVSTTNATYPILLCATADATANQGAKTGIFAKSVKINPSTNVISASGFSGPLTGNVTGNVTGNCSGSSGSCTGNAATATKATKDGSGNVITSTYATISDTAEMTAAEVSTVTAQVLT